MAVEWQEAVGQREAAEVAAEMGRKREEKAVKALEEVRHRVGELTRGKETAAREREALEEEVRRVRGELHQLREKVLLPPTTPS